MKYDNIQEEELKNKIAKNYFSSFDNTQIIGNIDFCVCIKKNKTARETESLLWAEAKKDRAEIEKSLTQLILTIGKAKTFNKYLPPKFLGCFDKEKIAFIPYSKIANIFYMNDFNWNVTPSNYNTKEFNLVCEKIKNILNKTLIFYYEKDSKDLKTFIKNNFVLGKNFSKIQVDKNNFMIIYNKWEQFVKPTIAVNWEQAKKTKIIDGDFYLADLLSSENETLKESLFVLLKKNKYELDKKIDKSGFDIFKTADFNDKQTAHKQFWNKYERPPKKEYWDYLVARRDLLVPQDVRERKGSFFTPEIWVEKSQEYIAKVLGDNWQDEYFIWDCACGTGNLLAGLTNKYNIYASTLDQQDVDILHDRIENGANLLKEYCFQFDFLNDDFSKLPQSLQNIINDENKRKKLLIYINPPYAEATSATTVTGTGKNKSGVANQNKIHEQYNKQLGNARNELFALFMMRIYKEIPNCKLAQFSTLKFVNGSNFKKFKNLFKAEYQKGFIVPANTFDNVKGDFPIGFTIWNLSIKEDINKISCDVYNENNEKWDEKNFYGNLPQSINKWIKIFDNKEKEGIGFMENPGTDFQNNKFLCILNKKGTRHVNYWNFIKNNIFQGMIYFSVRHCLKATWINDRDQFLTPKNTWQNDTEFQNNCLAYTLFHGQNRITAKDGTNHWIPFTEEQVNAKERFASHFMSDFINGKIKVKNENLQINLDYGENFNKNNIPTKPLVFSNEAQAVFDSGLELWKYYHQQKNINTNASLYDIKEYFQGRNEKTKRMNNKSKDEKYTELLENLKNKLDILAEKIQVKVFVYEFLQR